MSNDDFNKSEDLDNDLEHVALNVERQESPFSEKEHEAAKSNAASEQDRSLANIHTGSGREYEEPAPASPEEGDLEKDLTTEQTSEEYQRNQGELVSEQYAETEEVAEFTVSQEETASLNQSDFVIPQNDAPLGDLLPPTEQSSDQDDNTQELQNTPQDEAFTPLETEKQETSAEIAENTAPHSVALDDNSVDENSAIGTVVGTVSATDPEGDTLSYSLSDDAGGMFTIDPNSGEIKVAGALDHEAQDSYSVTVDVFDGEHTTQQTFTIDVGDVNEAAHSVALDD
ncbi:MAG: cadherin repeat domain-containing protein, partial [Sneathiellales bacterium]|nr:cadherin repeat domain-containing protein [Sneathiellales bacterium]